MCARTCACTHACVWQVLATLVGEQNAAMFGWGRPAVVTGGSLWASEPLHGLIRTSQEGAGLETGRVLAYALGPNFPRNGTVPEPASASATACVVGAAAKGRVGATLLAVPAAGVLAVGAPHSYLRARQSGAVYVVPL
jgi:hypothetical protein